MTERRGRRDERETLAAAVQRIQRIRNSKRIHAALTGAAGVDITQQSLQLLTGAEDGATSSDIAAATRMDAAAVSRELRRLEEAGLVRRENSPHHHAAVVVQLTDEGHRVRDRIKAVRDDHLARTLADWDRDDVDTLARLLHRFVDDLQANPLHPED